jgi:hypothetical protein
MFYRFLDHSMIMFFPLLFIFVYKFYGLVVLTAALIFINSLFFSLKNVSTACNVSALRVAKLRVFWVSFWPDILNSPQLLACVSKVCSASNKFS